MKRVALILENITWSFDYAMAEAFGMACEKDDVHLVIYEARYSSLDWLTAMMPQHGIEGVVVLADSIILSDLYESMRTFISQLSIPCVTIGPRFPSTPSVQSDNYTGMTMLMEHLFTQGAQRIAHLSGPSGNREAAARKAAYLAAMADRNITVQPEWLIEGLFSPMAGYNSMKKLLPLIRRGELDAITYANDESAAGGLRLLAAEGIRVPEDVRVTGYGDAPCSLLSFPGLTTVSNNPAGLARESLSLLRSPSRRTTDIQVECSPILLPNASTGCATRIDALRDLLRKRPMTELYHAEYFHDSPVSGEFWTDVAEKLRHYGVPVFHIVQYVQQAGAGTGAAADYRIPETARLLFAYSEGHRLPVSDPFSTVMLLPDAALTPTCESLVYKGLSYDDLPFGYMLISPKAAAIGHLDDIAIHCMAWLGARQKQEDQAQSNLRMSETMNQLIVTNRKLNELTVRNNLAGTNSTTSQKSETSELNLPDNRYMVMLVDIDGLRHINERFGYTEGDGVLTRVEEALSLCIRDTDHLVRQGGDSFLMLIKQASEEIIEVIQERMLTQLDRMNADLMKGYRIDFTWGYACGDGCESFESVVQKADEVLYRKKKERTVRIPG